MISLAPGTKVYLASKPVSMRLGFDGLAASAPCAMSAPSFSATAAMRSVRPPLRLPVPRGRAEAGLLAHVIVLKFADHLPLYRQSQIYAREGVEISRSTMEPLGQSSGAVALQPRSQGRETGEHLKTFGGFLQADAYAGFDRLYASGRKLAPITPVACWAHARRKINDVYKADPRSVAGKGPLMIRDLYEIERQISGEPADIRCSARKASLLKAMDFFA